MGTKKKFVVYLLLLLSFNNFGQAGVTINDTIYSGGILRKFKLYVPNSYNAATSVPLIFNLHGYGSNATQQYYYSNFMPIADTANFIMVYPEGTISGTSQYWNAGFGSGPNDVQFISNLIDSIKANYNIDLNSVYSCGMSNGGIMSYYLACNLPNRITAIASVTGSMLNSWYTSVPIPARAFPVMEIHGTNDPTVLYNGDATFAPIDSVVRKWRKYNNCTPTAITYSVPDINTADNCTAVNYLYANGTNGSTVELYKINGGGHTWPGAPVFSAGTNQDFKASVEIWRFFRKYKLNQFITNVGIPQANEVKHPVSIFPNPAKNTLTIQNGNENDVFETEISDLTGKIVKKEISNGLITITDLTDGVYFLKIKTNGSLTYSKFVKSDF